MKVKVTKDVFFANISGTVEDNHYLDLFIPSDNELDHGQIVSHGSNTVEIPYPNERSPGNDACLTTSLQDVKGFGESSLNRSDGKKDNVSKGKCAWTESIQDEYNIQDINLPLDDSEESVIEIVNEIKDENGFRNSQKSPLVIFVHGGGWRRGGREAWTHYLFFDVNFLLVIMSLLLGTYKNVGRALAKNGIACAVISYPLTEAGLMCLLAELCLSYIQSCLAVAIATLPVLGLLCFEFGLFLPHSTHVWMQINHQHGISVSTIILLIMLFTNFITLCLFTIKRERYKLRSLHIRTLWISLAIGGIFISKVQENKLLLTVILTFVMSQNVILQLRLSRWGSCYEDQTEVLALAVKWAKSVGQGTLMFDTSKVYLMGHSAGGHLVSLTALDDDILSKVGCSSNDIRVGIVTMY